MSEKKPVITEHVLNEILDDLKGEFNDAKADSAKAQQRMDRLNAELTALQPEKAAVKQLLTDYGGAHAALIGQKRDLDQYAKCTISMLSCDPHSKRLDDIERAVCHVQEIIDAKKQALEEKKSEAKKADEKNKAAQKHQTDAWAAYTALKATKKNLEDAFTDARNRKAKIDQESVYSPTARLFMALVLAEKLKHAVVRQDGELNEELMDSVKKLGDAISKAAKAQAELADANAAVGNLQTVVNRLESEKENHVLARLHVKPADLPDAPADPAAPPAAATGAQPAAPAKGAK